MSHPAPEPVSTAATTAFSEPFYLFPLSADSPAALRHRAETLADKLQANSRLKLADVAHTLQNDRHGRGYRQAIIGQTRDQFIKKLQRVKSTSMTAIPANQPSREVVFMFPGAGAQYPNMGRALYEHEAVYRHHVDACVALLNPRLGLEVRELLFPQPTQLEEAAEKLLRPSLALPILFTTCYALAEQWLAWGISPTAMIGHSVGEYVAACLAGVMSLAEALATVSLRGELFECVPEGGMLNVTATQAEIEPWLNEALSIAVVNAPTSQVVSGPITAIQALEEQLARVEIPTQRIKVSVAAHSAMLDPVLDSFARHMATIDLKPPEIPFISNVSGTWIRPEDGTDSSYWVRHLRQTVRFADGLSELTKRPNQVYLEVGPGRGLAALITQHLHRKKLPVVASMPSSRSKFDSRQRLWEALGGLWANGVELSWAALY